MKTISKGRRPPMEEDLKNIKRGIWLSTKQALTKRETLRVSWVWLCSTQNCHAFVKWKPIVFSSEMNFYFILLLINRNRIYSSNPALTLLWLASTPLLLGENPASWKTWGRNETIAAEQKKWNVPIEKCFMSDSRPMQSVSYWQSMNVCHLKAPILEECLQECEECGWKAPPEQHTEHTWNVTRQFLAGAEQVLGLCKIK